jgi:hypothetical protein
MQASACQRVCRVPHYPQRRLLMGAPPTMAAQCSLLPVIFKQAHICCAATCNCRRACANTRAECHSVCRGPCLWWPHQLWRLSAVCSLSFSSKLTYAALPHATAGERVSTRVQSATLSAVAPADGGPTNYGGSVQFALCHIQTSSRMLRCHMRQQASSCQHACRVLHRQPWRPY